MGLVHAWRMQKLVAEARAAHARGDRTFTAGFDIDPRANIPMKKIRKEIDLIVDAVEPIGWKCVQVQPFLNSVEIGFLANR
ncbi:hypothetical protein [Streptomyces sp. NPDC049555]|uniref:hypothetical protein n=1 Tax=Streptomyces sp. NPDC049555 TaxID=3154930 RepID=UPI003447DE96